MPARSRARLIVVPVRFAVIRDSVDFVETRKVNAGRSILAGAGGVVVLVSLVSVVGLLALLASFE